LKTVRTFAVNLRLWLAPAAPRQIHDGATLSSEFVESLYGPDLAYIHAAAFGGLAHGAAPEILRLLKSAAIPIHSVVDAGCGAGVLTAILIEAGFNLTGIDVSSQLLEIAHAAVTRARFINASIYETEIPPCEAILAIGEPLTYHADATRLVEDFFRRASAALPIGGMLIFDVIETGEPPLDGRSWSSGEDWAVLVQTTEDRAARTLLRSIETFRCIDNPIDNLYRRGREIHRVHVFESDELTKLLSACGFEVQTAQAYGTYPLAPRRRAFFCTRRERPSTDAPVAAIWKRAEDAVIAGDAPTLERLLTENEQLFRDGEPPEYGPGGLRPDYSGGDARAIILREHQFETWQELEDYRAARAAGASPLAKFEAAADAIVTGDESILGRLLRENPELVHARSTRRHKSPLLHYLGGINGGESYRQKCPRNSVTIANMLLDAGAPVDVAGGPYGNCTALGSIATSIQPMLAGIAEPLMETMLKHGADINANPWPIVNGCLANGRPWAAEFLANRGARLDLEGAAGIGRLDLVKAFFDPDGSLKASATAKQMRDGFTWACEFGRDPVVEFLLERGMDVSAKLRHHGQTGLHWAAGGAHVETVKMLLAHGAPVDAKDESWSATPLSWTLFGWRNRSPQGAAPERYVETVRLLVEAGATVEPDWLRSEDVRATPDMLRALGGVDL
jgi:SAM-dependent methyltransferase